MWTKFGDDMSKRSWVMLDKTDRLTDRQTDRQTNQQTNILANFFEILASNKQTYRDENITFVVRNNLLILKYFHDVLKYEYGLHGLCTTNYDRLLLYPTSTGGVRNILIYHLLWLENSFPEYLIYNFDMHTIYSIYYHIEYNISFSYNYSCDDINRYICNYSGKWQIAVLAVAQFSRSWHLSERVVTR